MVVFAKWICAAGGLSLVEDLKIRARAEHHQLCACSGRLSTRTSWPVTR
jgi:hypothetical protein